jgi:hypothetical protein
MSTGHVVKTLEKQLSKAQSVINDLVRENYELKTQLTSMAGSSSHTTSNTSELYESNYAMQR